MAKDRIIKELKGEKFIFIFSTTKPNKSNDKTSTLRKVNLSHSDLKILTKLQKILDDCEISYKRNPKTIQIEEDVFEEIFKEYLIYTNKTKGNNPRGKIDLPLELEEEKIRKRKLDKIMPEEQGVSLDSTTQEDKQESPTKKPKLIANEPQETCSENQSASAEGSPLLSANMPRMNGLITQEMINHASFRFAMEEVFITNIKSDERIEVNPSLFKRYVEEVAKLLGRGKIKIDLTTNFTCHFSSLPGLFSNSEGFEIEEVSSSSSYHDIMPNTINQQITYNGEVAPDLSLVPEETPISSLTEDDIEHWIQEIH